MNSKRILIGSPIYQKPNILKEFLHSLEELDKTGLNVDLLFIDDNKDFESSQILQLFDYKDGHKYVVDGSKQHNYVCDDTTHKWNEQLIWKVGIYKDAIIQIAIENEYDYLFFIDSDLVLHPDTLQQLVASKKDIITNIFWTKWTPDSPALPQVWVSDQYNLYEKDRSEKLNDQQTDSRIQQFLQKLQKPGVYEVGGLGACTLISKKALLAGVCFKEIKNVSFWGEDRHFCIRAAALGIELFVDTHYPAYHIYRESDLTGIPAYKENYKNRYNEICKLKVFYTIYEGIQNLGTYRYESGYKKEWRPYFSPELQVKLEQEINNSQELYRTQSVTVSATVTDCTILSTNNNQFEVSFLLNNTGVKNNIQFEEQYLCKCIVIENKDNHSGFEITMFEILDTSPALPFEVNI